MAKENLEELIEEIRWGNNRHRNNNHTLKKLDKFLPWFLFVGGLIEIVAGIHFFLTDPAGSRWVRDISFGGVFIIFGIWWYVRINKLSTKLVTSSGILFGMFLTLLAIYRANFIIHGYDLASSVAFVLGVCITSTCAAYSKADKRER